MPLDFQQTIDEVRALCTGETDEIALMATISCHLYQQIEGFDWVNLFIEEERDEVMHEFHSCLEMNRRFNKTTRLQNGKEVRLLGYPYRISEHEHGGFLISITENEV